MGDSGSAEQGGHATLGHALPGVAAAEAAAAAQWAQSVAGMQQALLKGAHPPFLPPLAAYANPAQFAPGFLYNAQLMGGMGGLAPPFPFVPGAMQQAQAMLRAGPPGGLPPAAPSGKEQRPSEDGGAQKRQRRERSSSETRADADGSRASDSRSPVSEPGSEARLTALGGDSEPAGLGASASVHSLAGAGGLQDEREVKKLRRKQSNRESARRSRLRKQAECEALAGRVGELQAENARLAETNRQLLARVEELVAKLEQRAAPGRPVAFEGSAFAPVAAACRPPSAGPPAAAGSETVVGSSAPSAAAAVKQELAESAAGPDPQAVAAAETVIDSCPAG